MVCEPGCPAIARSWPAAVWGSDPDRDACGCLRTTPLRGAHPVSGHRRSTRSESRRRIETSPRAAIEVLPAANAGYHALHRSVSPHRRYGIVAICPTAWRYARRPGTRVLVLRKPRDYGDRWRRLCGRRDHVRVSPRTRVGRSGRLLGAFETDVVGNPARD